MSGCGRFGVGLMLDASLVSSALIEPVQAIATLFCLCNEDCEAVSMRRVEPMRNLLQYWDFMNVQYVLILV